MPVGRGLEVWQNFSRCPAIEVSIFDDLHAAGRVLRFGLELFGSFLRSTPEKWFAEIEGFNPNEVRPDCFAKPRSLSSTPGRIGARTPENCSVPGFLNENEGTPNLACRRGEDILPFRFFGLNPRESGIRFATIAKRKLLSLAG